MAVRPFSLLIKPSGSDCNIDCDYCFYKNRAPEIGQGRQRMSDAVLETLIRQYLALGFAECGFSWQGGEPLLMGLDFFRRVVALQERYGRSGQAITNALQTNGILLTEDWAPLLRDYRFLLGISCDGPRELHDAHRVDLAGHGTWERVWRGIDLCREQGIAFNVLVLVNRLTAEHPETILDFFVDRGIRWLQFVPCVEREPGIDRLADVSVTAEQYGRFLCRVFDRWLALGPTTLSIRDFDSIVQHAVTGRHSVCTYSRHCADYVVIEHTGDAFPCDFFVDPALHLGNITETPLEVLAHGPAKRAFARRKSRLPQSCLICPYLDVCRGGCVKDRLPRPDGGTPVCHLCAGYKTFFAHALPRLRQVAAQLHAERPAVGDDPQRGV